MDVGRPRPLRILFVSFIQNRDSTGMGRWTHRVVKALERRGHEVEAWFSEHFPRISRMGARWPVLLLPPVLASECSKERERFDVVVVHEPLGFWCGVTRRLLPTRMPPFVSMCHNVESHHFADMRRAASSGYASVSAWSWLIGGLARRWQSDGAVRHADAVVCLSNYDRNYIVGRLRVPSARVFLVTNGVETLPLAHEGVRDGVLFVGGWRDVKGRRLLPTIMAAVLERAPETKFTLVGIGAAREPVLQSLSPAVRKQVEVLPTIEDEKVLRSLMERNAVLLMPSLSEGSPLALLEGMAAEMGIVASRVGGIPDVLRDGETGLLFPVGDVKMAADLVVQLVTNPQRRERLGHAARAETMRRSWDATAGELERALFAAAGSR